MAEDEQDEEIDPMIVTNSSNPWAKQFWNDIKILQRAQTDDGNIADVMQADFSNKKEERECDAETSQLILYADPATIKE